MSDMIKVSICDDKYTIIQDASGRTNVLRYGEPWRDVTGDNVILGAAYEIDKLQSRIKRLEKAGDRLLTVMRGEEGTAYCEWIGLAHDAEQNWIKTKKNKP